jgi:cytoskeleton protein RodZ
MVEGEDPESGLFPQSVGERLRILRESAKLDLNDIATKTRIPLRHLQSIERGDYSALPSPTYAMGFTRSYARALDADDAPLIASLRQELGRDDPALRGQLPYEPVDPARVPSRLLAWTAAGLAVLLAIGYGLWRTQYYGSDAVTPVPTETAATPPPVAATTGAPAPQPAAAAPAPATGDVVLTATAPVWLRIYDAKKVKLLEKEMAVGESYAVPATADNPQILTGRPDGLKVTVGGREVPPLGTADKAIKDVGISAAALAARPPASVMPATAPAVPATPPAL